MLMLPGEVPATAEQAKAVRTAVCSEGRELSVRYLGFQNAVSATSGRQSATNLKNEEGHLFTVVGAATRPGGTCLMLPSGYTQRYPLVHNDYPEVERRQQRESYRRINGAGAELPPFEERGDFARAAIARIERAKNRKVRLYWVLHSTGPAQQIAIVEFVPEGDSLLASLVLADAQRLSFLDMPADRTKGKAGGCWRVDDDCRLNPEEMNVAAVLGASTEALVFYTAAGAEGQLVRLLQVEDGMLVEVKTAYRYQAPI